MLDAFLAIYERVQIRSTDTNRRCTEADGLQDVGPSFETSINVHLERIENLRTLLSQL